MQQPIVGFHQDQQQHWVADLACGHTQHVRHDPPWQERTWVLTAASREARLGATLDCVCCDEAAFNPATAERKSGTSGQPPAHLSPAAAAAYLDALLQGLCHEGALEIAERLDAKGACERPPADRRQGA
jgi:hypothetical protein